MSYSDGSTCFTEEQARFLIDHCFLPPKLPETSDGEGHAGLLLDQLHNAAQKYGSYLTGEDGKFWAPLRSSVKTWALVWADSKMCESTILDKISSMHMNSRLQTPNFTPCLSHFTANLLIFIQAQNAALLLTKLDHATKFEMWEVTARQEVVLSTKDALIRDFPGRAIEIPALQMSDRSFLQELSAYIFKLAVEVVVSESMEHVRKGGRIIEESRQSNHPRLVSEWLFDVVLASHGNQVITKTIRKRTHDDVSFRDTLLPFRRSAILSSAKVALQLAISNSALADPKNTHYKQFVLYFLCCLITPLLRCDPPLHYLHVLRSKIARRAAKLPSPEMPSFLDDIFKSTILSLTNAANTKLEAIHRQDSKLLPLIKDLDQYPGMLQHPRNAFLDQIDANFKDDFKQHLKDFKPKVSTPIVLPSEELPDPIIFNATGEMLLETIVVFERWVEHNLRQWAADNRPSTSACLELKVLIDRFWSSSRACVAPYAELTSIVLLTVFELWVALDQKATKLCPLLTEYPPEISPNVFGPLLMSKASHLRRLRRIEEHIKLRWEKCRPSNPSLFGAITPQSFSVAMFERKSSLQALREEINRKAADDKAARKEKFYDLKAEFDELMDEVKAMKCSRWYYWEGPRAGTHVHHRRCERCAIRERALRMQIEKFEEPLPSYDVLQKAVVFELQPDAEVVAWRDATWQLVHDILSPTVNSGPAARQNLYDYPPLQKYFHPRRRVTMASSKKAHSQTHRFETYIMAPEDAIFLSHALDLQIYDTSKTAVWTKDQNCEQSLARFCQPRINNTPYGHLSDSLRLTTISQNSIIARQSACPTDLNVRDFVVFGSLRSGSRLQMVNLLRTLLAQELDFSSSATVSMIEQILHEAGKDPVSGFEDIRDDHVDMRIDRFATALLDKIETILSNISANWKETNTAWAMKAILLRILTLTPWTDAAQRCLSVVSRVRSMCFEWVLQLAKIYAEQRNTGASTTASIDTRRRLFETAMLTRSTWDVDEARLGCLLQTEEEVAQYATCAVYIHDLSGKFEESNEKWLRLCVARDKLLRIKIEALLASVIKRWPQALLAGIRRVWETADIMGAFQPCNCPEDRWIYARRKASQSLVHYNIFTGALLVAGKPLSTLPDQYAEDPLFKQVFGDFQLDVVASDDPKYEYVTSNSFGGHKVYLGYRGGVQYIQSRKNRKHYVALNRSIFKNKLPTRLLERFEPWYCVETAQVGFRDSEEAKWQEKEPFWTLTPAPQSEAGWIMESKYDYLISGRSELGSKICNVLCAFEDRQYIHITKSKMTGDVSVEMPRYGLHFALISSGDHAGLLECKELAAFVAQDQSIGTLYGLESRLVLHSRGSHPKRWILIPFGEAIVKRADPHVKVEIDISDFDEMIFFQYRVDDTLGTLSSDEVEAHLWKSYLHALTSTCLPDPLTNCTGVEESFSSLKDSIVRQTVPFSTRSQQILERISHLAPARSFYPDPATPQLQVVQWNQELPFLSQHDLFYEMVYDITTYNYQVAFLYEDTTFVIPAYRGNDKDLLLARRAKWAWQKLFRIGYIADKSLPAGDKFYRGRDKERSRNTDPAFEIAVTIRDWRAMLPQRHEIYAALRQQGLVRGFNFFVVPELLNECVTLDVMEAWPSLLTYCLKATKIEKNEMIFKMSLVAFGSPEHFPTLATLVAFAIDPALKGVGLPAAEEYDLSAGSTIDWSLISYMFEECTAINYTQETLSEADDLSDEVLINEILIEQDIIKALLKQSWPCSSIQLEELSGFKYIRVDKLLPLLNGRLKAWAENLEFQKHCRLWQIKLDNIAIAEKTQFRPRSTVQALNQTVTRPKGSFPSLLQKMQATEVPENIRKSDLTALDRAIQIHSMSPQDAASQAGTQRALCDHLQTLLSDGMALQEEVGRKYRQGLLDSNAALRSKEDRLIPDHAFLTECELKHQLAQVKASLENLLKGLESFVRPQNTAEFGLRIAELWPKVSTYTLLQLLSRKFRDDIPAPWKVLLIGFAREICARQRLQRLIRFLEDGDKFAMAKELQNASHSAWNQRDNLDWLLFEIQNDILIRPVQIKIAQELIKGKNGVLQLQMGDGKSSVITPMICASTSNGSRLVRVIVLRSLGTEMVRSLSKALSGLVQRSVYYLPFSRSTRLSKSTASSFRQLWKDCRENGAVLLALPEHLNSFRLIGNDQLAAGRLDLASSLLSAQKWLDNNTRDLIDEADSVLHPRNELVYTNGEDKPLSGTPFRWSIVLSVLDLIPPCAEQAVLEVPHGLEVKSNGPNAVPSVRIINDEGGRVLLNAILHRIFTDELPALPFSKFDRFTQEAMQTFIQNIQVMGQVHQAVINAAGSRETMLALHLLRGLFAWGYLPSALKKRWHVEYGLSRERCLCAVPYRSKGVPATAAEFAQPDMMVLLTALSYYYTGLQLEDTRRSLGILLRMPDPADEYSQWVKDCNIMNRYRDVAGVNLQDDSCTEHLHEYLYKRKPLIDFFLKHVVLAKESKEYPFKLSSSAWDLCAGTVEKVTQGFSGTTDALMPQNMPIVPVADLQHFDAEVLVHLLQPRNRRYVYAASDSQQPFETNALLSFLGERAPEISVIIDVGAQTLDRNVDVAFAWLLLRDDKWAAVYFDENDEKMVVTRDTRVTGFQSSPFKEQLHRCLIYLDQHHTRGTDFSLPDNVAAAVLLGPSLQKDSLVQGCMRLRKLAYQQKVVFFGTPEVDNDIRATLKKSAVDGIDSADVIQWSIQQSCRAIQSQQILRVTRTLEFLKRNKAFIRQINDHGKVKNRTAYIENVRSTETNDAEKLYPVGVKSLAKPPNFSPQERADREIAKMLLEYQKLDRVTHFELSRYDEQEREILHEVEEEREVQRPKSMNPKVPTINRYLKDIIMHNRNVQVAPNETVPAFELMGATSLFAEHLRKKLLSGIVATRDYLDTVKSSTGTDLDDFLRPVNWIIKLNLVRELIIIGPHEVQELLPYLRRSSVATLIAYSPKVTKTMTSFDNLNIYTVPPRARVDVDPDVLAMLRLFAGQLYFDKVEEYERFCTLLGLPFNTRLKPQFETTAPKPKTRMLQLSYKIVKKPDFVPLIKRWIDMRQKGIEWTHTHVGRVLDGQKLQIGDFPRL